MVEVGTTISGLTKEVKARIGVRVIVGNDLHESGRVIHNSGSDSWD